MSRAPYDPSARYPVDVFDVPYRQDAGYTLLARVYRPDGPGPFPSLLDVHGGVWSGGSRQSDALMDLQLASSGLVVVAVDFRLSPQHPYPAQVTDVNYATRWLKSRAAEFRADAATLGGIGASSGGNTVALSALRPHDPRYACLPLPGAPDQDASLAYVVAMWSVLDPVARYGYAKEARADLASRTEAYFPSEEAMRDGSPQHVVERGEAEALPPFLIIQGTADANIPNSIPRRFEETYRKAGGAAEYHPFPDMPHGFANRPGAEAAQALELVREFIARQMGAAAE